MPFACDLVVVTWNGLAVTKEFVRSLLSNTVLPVRVIIVDNGSQDGTREYLRALASTPACRFEIIFNEQNEGFIRGQNKGLARSTAPYVCLANNDLIFTPHWLEEMLSVFRCYPGLGVLHPNSNNFGTDVPTGMTLDDFAGDLRRKWSGQMVEMSLGVGFFMMITRAAVQKLGGFAEDFLPMFFEDRDYCLRAIQAGYQVGMARAAYIHHKEHASMGQLGGERERIFRRSRDVFERKWGRTLRIAWIVDGDSALLRHLPKGIELARAGNFVNFFVRGAQATRADIFRQLGRPEFSGVDVIPYKASAALGWKMWLKKKKFDAVIVQRQPLGTVLRLLGQNVFVAMDDDRLRKLKFVQPSARA